MESISLGPPSQENLQPAATDGDRPSPVPIPRATIQRTDSGQSSSKASLLSHQSVPVTGTFPLGSLRVHQVMDSPRPRAQPEPRPQADLSEMPPLEDGPGVDTAPLDGDVFLILDLRPNSTVGCDARAINTGTSGFKGIRDIPPGPHFVWVSEPNALSRCGYWFVAQDKARVRVKQWDKYNEVLAEPASKFELRDHRDNVASLYPQLVSFRHGESDQATTSAAVGGPGGDDGDETQLLWRQLTSGISEGLLARVTRRSDASEWLVATSDTAQGEAGFPQTTQLYKAVVGPRELEFLFPEGDVDLAAAAVAAGRRGQADNVTTITDDADADATGPPDTSSEILRLVDTPGTGVSEADVLGELQLTFLTGIHLTNLSCVDQWWHLVLKVVLRAHRLALQRPRLAADLLRTLHAQMVYDEKYIAGGGDGDPRDQGTSILDIVPVNKRKLRRALALYRRRLDQLLLDLPRGQATAEQGAVGKAFGELEAWFWKFGWDLRTGSGGGEEKRPARDGYGIIARGDDDDNDDDDDDYKPVIVDLDADGREVGLVSFS